MTPPNPCDKCSKLSYNVECTLNLKLGNIHCPEYEYDDEEYNELFVKDLVEEEFKNFQKMLIGFMKNELKYDSHHTWMGFNKNDKIWIPIHIYIEFYKIVKYIIRVMIVEEWCKLYDKYVILEVINNIGYKMNIVVDDIFNDKNEGEANITRLFPDYHYFTEDERKDILLFK